jgi:hypothetical protein
MVANRSSDDHQWAACIDRLIQLTALKNLPVREGAALRLGKLYQLSFLSTDERTRYANALWAFLDPQTGLPVGTGVAVYGFLELPSPDQERAKTLIREVCLSHSIAPIYSTSTGPDGKPRQSIVFGVDPMPWIRAFEQCATRPGRKGDWIDWTKADCLAVVAKIDEWWTREGSPASSRTFSLSDPLSGRVVILLNALCHVVAPRLEPNGSGSADVCRLINELSQTRPGEFALPAVAYLAPESLAKVTAQIRQAIVSADPERSDMGIRAIHVWLQNSKTRGWPSMPPDLVNELGNIIATRRQPRLFLALAMAAAIARKMAEACTSEFVELVNRGLDYLLAELDYEKGQKTPEFSGNARLRLRMECVKLATALRENLGVSNAGWLTAVENDPMRGVRLAGRSGVLDESDD